MAEGNIRGGGKRQPNFTADEVVALTAAVSKRSRTLSDDDESTTGSEWCSDSRQQATKLSSRYHSLIYFL